MIKTPLSTVLGGAFWTPGATVINGAKPGFETVMKKLFANGEQGFYYDPNDLSTMFQDAAGTVPVTAVGQPVGLLLDKSKGLVLGGNIIPNGSFSSDIAWNKGAGWAIADGVARFDGSATFSILGNVTSSSINGKWLRVEFDLSNVGASVTQVRILVSGLLAAIIPVSGAGKYSAMVLGGSAQAIGIQTQGASGANYAFTLDNVSVKEVFGNHAYQTTSASRPILRKNAVTGANYLELDGADDFLVTNSIDFTATDKVSLFAGVRKLSDDAMGVITELGNAQISSFIVHCGGGGGTEAYTFGSRGSGLYSYAALNKAANPSLLAPHSAVLTAKAGISATAFIKANDKSTIKNSNQGTGNYDNYPLYIGRRGGTSLPFNGHIYSLIGIGKLASDNETVAIEKELAKRVGVTL